LGVVNCDNMLMLLGVSQKLTDHDRDIVVPLLMKGFTVRNYCHLFVVCLCQFTVNCANFGCIFTAHQHSLLCRGLS